MADSAGRRASYDDVVAAPANMVAEIFDGELRLSPRPAKPHAAVKAALGEELGPPFKRGRGGPGGWIILDEPEVLSLGTDGRWVVRDASATTRRCARGAVRRDRVVSIDPLGGRRDSEQAVARANDHKFLLPLTIGRWEG